MKATIKRMARSVWQKLGFVHRPLGRRLQNTIFRGTTHALQTFQHEFDHQRREMHQLNLQLQLLMQTMQTMQLQMNQSIQNLELNLDGMVREMLRLQYRLDHLAEVAHELNVPNQPDVTDSVHRAA